jgi:hypothetical protein
MTFVRLLQRLPRIPHRFALEADLYARLTWMRLMNRFGWSPITHPGGPVVSMTTYGNRIQSVHLAIESIGQGQIRPSRVILWIDDASLVDNLPIGIRRLQKRGLEVKLCNNYGPHKKYYPYLESLPEVEAPLVTADDDLLYPRYWLKRLVKAFQQFPDVVNCHRARVMVLNQDGIAKYKSWELADSMKPSFCHFAGGGAGAMYPLPLQRALKQEGTAFLDCCPKADDIWLHVQALRAGYKIRQIDKKQFRLVEIPGTQCIALNHQNLGGGGNDRQIETTYRASDLDRLRERE